VKKKRIGQTLITRDIALLKLLIERDKLSRTPLKYEYSLAFVDIAKYFVSELNIDPTFVRI
jgi:hypothetical protein